MPHQFDAFLSYAGEDAEFAAWLVAQLQQTGLRIWFAEEQMPAGADIQKSLAETLTGEPDKIQHGIFLISDAWLAKDWTTWELDVFSENRTQHQRLIPIVRNSRSAARMGPNLRRGKSVSWPEDEKNLYARLWEVFCGVTGEAPGPKRDWERRARKETGGAPIKLAPSIRDTSTNKPLDPARLLTLDRDPQWGALTRVASDALHQAIFVIGPQRQGHSLFLDRLISYLPRDPQRRLVEVPWELQVPATRGAALGALERSLDLTDGQLVASISSQLRTKNLVFVHRPVFEESTTDYLFSYYTDWLPGLLNQLPENLQGRIKLVHALRWPDLGILSRGWQSISSVLGNKTAQRRANKYAAARAFMDGLRRGPHPDLAVAFLDQLAPLTRKQVAEWLLSCGVDKNDVGELVDYAFDGLGDTVDIFERIRERLTISGSANNAIHT